MTLLSKPNTFSAGTTIKSADVNSDFDTLYNDYNGNITNANISASAAILGTKLDLTSVGAIGSTAASAGKFTTLEATTSIKIPTSEPASLENGMIWVA